MPSRDDILHAKILVVDDSADNVELMLEILREAGYTDVSSTMLPEQVCPMHRQHCYDLILLDLQMPGLNGFQVMKGLKEIEQGGYLPVLALTAQPSFKIAALEAGARDFISKPFDLLEVHKRIHNMLEVRLLYKELAQYSKQQQELALHDPLTGLPNRRLLEDRIATVLQHATRQQNKAAVMYLDLDGFKPINDTYGHAAGDECLRAIAQVVRSTVIRPGDVCARYGGEEVAVLLAATDAKAAHAIAESIRVGVEEIGLEHGRNPPSNRATISVGLATLTPGQDLVTTSQALFKRADEALYNAKAAGRNRVETAGS